MFSTPFKALHFAIIFDYKQHCDCFLLNVVGYNVYHAATNKGQPPLKQWQDKYNRQTCTTS